MLLLNFHENGYDIKNNFSEKRKNKKKITFGN